MNADEILRFLKENTQHWSPQMKKYSQAQIQKLANGAGEAEYLQVVQKLRQTWRKEKEYYKENWDGTRKTKTGAGSTSIAKGYTNGGAWQRKVLAKKLKAVLKTCRMQALHRVAFSGHYLPVSGHPQFRDLRQHPNSYRSSCLVAYDGS